MEALLNAGELYHYHTKLMMKEARTGGRWNWHQDYGYWYNNGCLFPDMGSVFMALDPCTVANGCLQVLVGSHKMGRVDHVTEGEQAGADLERVAWAEKRFKRVHVELKPGDALFFHCNLLHTSAANESEDPRYALIAAYNAKSNDPTKLHHHPAYHDLRMLGSDAVINCNVFGFDPEKRDFINPSRDTSHFNKPKK